MTDGGGRRIGWPPHHSVEITDMVTERGRIMTMERLHELGTIADTLRDTRKTIKAQLDAAIQAAARQETYSDAWMDAVARTESLKATLKALDKTISNIEKAVE